MSEQEQEHRIYMDRRASTPTSAMERHAQTIIGAILVGLIAWVGMSVTSSKEDIAKLQTNQENIKSALVDIKSDLKIAVRDRFTATQAREMRSGCQDRMNKLENRLDNLERLENVRHNRGMNP